LDARYVSEIGIGEVRAGANTAIEDRCWANQQRIEELAALTKQ
jgi:hypothetical protein